MLALRSPKGIATIFRLPSGAGLVVGTLFVLAAIFGQAKLRERKKIWQNVQVEIPFPQNNWTAEANPRKWLPNDDICAPSQNLYEITMWETAECRSAVRYGLADMIDQWLREVQQPALQKPSYDTKWLWFSDSSPNGGFADKVFGIMNTFLLAVVTNRAFGIDWRSPLNLSAVLEPHTIPWASDFVWAFPNLPPNSNVHSIWGIPRIECVDKNWRQCFPDSLSRKVGAKAGRVIILCCNMWNWFAPYGASSDPEFRDLVRGRLKHFNGSQVMPLPLARIFGCLFHRLFKASSQVQELLERANQEIRGRPLLCVQLRLGNGAAGAQDTEIFINQTQLNQIGKLLSEFAARQGEVSKYAIYVTSDSNVSAHHVIRAAGFALDNLVLSLIEKSAVHITRSFQAHAAAGFPGVVASFILLGKCGPAVTTERSGFGRMGITLRGTTECEHLFENVRMAYCKDMSFRRFCDNARTFCGDHLLQYAEEN